MDRLQFYQKFVRVWASSFNAYEFMVMSQLIDRTVGWGQQSIEITTARLRKGDGLYRGIEFGISRAQLFKVLASLEEKGCISRKTERDRVVINVNTRWEPEVIAIPKRLRGETEHAVHLDDFAFVQPVADQELTDRSTLETTPSLLETTPVSIMDPLKGTSGKGTTEGNTASQDDCVSAEDAVLIGRMKNLDARSGKLRKSKADPQAVWRNAFIETFPGVIPERWSIKDQGRVKTAKKAFLITSGHSFEDFLQWTVENWATIIAKKFSWMKDDPAPTVPRIGFVIGMYTHFIEAFGTWVYEGWLSDKQRTELEKLKARGMSHDEALMEIAKNETASRLRGEMSKREAEMQRVAAGARADRRQAEKDRTFVDRYSSGVPIHPKSRLAQEMGTVTGRQPSRDPLPHNLPKTDKLAAPKVKFDD